jgi:hypothetical protein
MRLVEITIVDRTGQHVITTDVQLLTAWDHTPGMEVDRVVLPSWHLCSRRPRGRDLPLERSRPRGPDSPRAHMLPLLQTHCRWP